MKNLFLMLAVVAVLCLPPTAMADTLTFLPGGSPGSPLNDLNDLDHHLIYTWRIDNVNLPTGHTITGARIGFGNIANWNSASNVLFVHLLDSAKNAGISSFVDSPNDTGEIDHFVDTTFHNQANWLLNAGTADTYLTKYEDLPTSPQTLVYNLTQAQLAALSTYILNGNNFALGFDPDCHFFNDWIAIQIFTAPAAVPEPTTMVLLGTGIAGLYLRRRRRRQ